MAYLTDPERAAGSAAFQAFCSNLAVGNAERTFGALTKADIRAAYNALDAYLEDNKATINSAIPPPARAELTTRQKARIMVDIINRRYIAEV